MASAASSADIQTNSHIPSPPPRALVTAELRQHKPNRSAFRTLPRRPITVVLDGVRQPYNIGAIFRLCDAFLVERLVLCGTRVELHKRKLVQAARGTQRWVPWIATASATEFVVAAKAAGAWIVAVEQTTNSVPLDALVPRFPMAVVFGGETEGVSKEIIDMADSVASIPMFGMANSLNVSTTAAIVLYRLRLAMEEPRGVP